MDQSALNQSQLAVSELGDNRFDRPLPEASPFSLRALARLCGLEPASPVSARVLEIGCGSGGHLQPFALACPQSEIVGIELWPDEIERGRKEAEALGIQNLHLLPLLCTDLDDNFGQFDYIIIRDEYVWAPQLIRDALWQVCRERLSPQGVVYMGSCVGPGWRAGDVLRDAIQLHSHDAITLEEIRDRAGAVLGLLSHGVSGSEGKETKAAAKRVLSHPEYYISADFLQRTTVTPYFIDIITSAQSAGLGYQCDTNPLSEQPSTYGQATQLQHSLVTMGKPWVVKQQYLDFATSRKFRGSVFALKSASSGAVLSELRHLNFASSLKRRLSFFVPSQATVGFVGADDRTVSFDDPWAVAICDALGGVWPQTLSFKELVRATHHVEPGIEIEAHERMIEKALKSLLESRQLRWSYGPGPYDLVVAGRIRLIGRLEELAVPDSKEPVSVKFNLWNEPKQVRIERSPKLLVQLFEEIANERFVLLEKHVDLIKFIDYLKWQGLLLGSDEAWVKYYSAVLQLDNQEIEKEKIHYLPAYVGHFIRSVANDEKLRQARSIDSLVSPPHRMMAEMNDLRNKRSFEKLEKLTKSFIDRFPRHDYGWHVMALMHRDMGERDKALMAFFKALSCRPNDPHLLTGLAITLDPVRGAPFMSVLLGLSLWIRADYAPAYINLVLYYRDCDKRNLALRCADEALKLEPADYVALKNKGVVLSEVGEVSQSVSLLEKVIQQYPFDFATHTNLLYAMSLSDQVNPETLYQAHLRFGRAVETYVKKSKATFSHHNERTLNRPLILGFVSGDLRNHAVSRFIEPVWEEINHNLFKVFVYNNHAETDGATVKLKSLTDKWMQIESLSDEQAASQINADKVDILFDLSGHTGFNRLAMFGFKPAPIQVSWIGYPGTTGLKTMDYFFVNEHQAPKGMLDEQFTEKLVRMRASSTFDAGEYTLQPNELPALKNGFFTFASFNRMNKVNPAVLEVWAKILEQVPDSRLIIGHVEAEQYDVIRNIFTSHKIDDNRLIFQAKVPVAEYMEIHHQVDLLLDAFPYNGGTTTCYGLWMGVPTITLAGKSVPARTGAAIMGASDLSEFVASDVSEYIERAVRFSTNLSRLAEIRHTARAKFTDTDSVWRTGAVVKDLQLALRHAWRLWCQGKSAESFDVADIELESNLLWSNGE